MTRPALVAVALLVLAAALRRPSLRPVAATLLVLAALDLARLWTAPRAPAWPWGRADVLLVILWPGVLAAGAALSLEVSRRRVAVGALAFLAYALAVAALGPRLAPWHRETLLAPRIVAALVLGVAWLSTLPRLASVPLLLVAAGDAVAAAIVWTAPAERWWLAQGLSLACYAACACATIWAWSTSSRSS